MKIFIKKCIFVLVVFSTLVLGLVLVNTIPKKYIEKNVKESINTFMKEGYYPKIKYTNRYLLDNYTDALMIDTAYSIDNNEVLKSTMLMRHGYRANADLKLNDINEPDKPITNLEQNVSETNTSYFEYFRYWHGYMLYLRPLLVLFNYSQIRAILITIIVALSLLLVYLAYKNINVVTAIATALMLVFANFWAIGLSLQYTATFMISLIASIYILVKKDKIKDIAFVFFIIGMLTSFFDMFSTPMLTFCIPVLFWIAASKKEKYTLKGSFMIGFSWVLGYGMMWLSKWIMLDLIYNTGAIKDAISKILLYTVSKEEVKVNILTILGTNIYYLEMGIIVSAILLLWALMYNTIVLKNKTKKDTYQYLLISVLPFVWYLIIKNHSYIHARFTFRILLITIFAWLIIFGESLLEKKSEKNK